MQQVSTQSAVRAASAADQAPLAPGSPQTDAAAADLKDAQPPHVEQNEEQGPDKGPETLEQLQNGQPLTEAQQRQMQLSAAKQQRAAEQRQQLVDRARQVVAAADCNGQQTRAGTDDASASADLARQQQPMSAAGAAGALADAPTALAPAELAAQLVARLGAAAATLDAAANQDAARLAANEEEG
jgi:hypothetical protein